MNKSDITLLINKHSDEISELKEVSAQMMLLWRLVGAVALAALGVYLATQFGGAS